MKHKYRKILFSSVKKVNGVGDSLWPSTNVNFLAEPRVFTCRSCLSDFIMKDGHIDRRSN